MKRNPRDLFADRTRSVEIGVLYQRDDQNNIVTMDIPGVGEVPQIQGIGFHMHSTATYLGEDGVVESKDCDYVLMDLAQIAQLKDMLAGIEIMKED